MRGIQVLAGAAILALAGCETLRSEYGPSPGGDRPGYAETQTAPDRFFVRYVGGRGATPGRVEQRVLYRAAELTVENGYDGFRRLTKETTRPDVQPGDVDPYDGGSGIGIGVFGGSSSGIGVGVGFPIGGGGGTIESRSEIALFRGPAPREDPTAFDARAILAGGPPPR